MREILFRGKRIDNGEWVHGYYAVIQSPFDKAGKPEKHIICNGTNVFNHEVIPETVGQYTGLTDKNGVKIFEGDILRVAKRMDGMGACYHPPIQFPVLCIVKWDMCAWMWETIEEKGIYIGFPDAWCHYECEVIGNIHDNPELLGGKP